MLYGGDAIGQGVWMFEFHDGCAFDGFCREAQQLIAIASGEKIRRGERIGKALLLYQAWTITVISIFCSQVQPLREETSSCAISLYTAIDCAY